MTCKVNADTTNGLKLTSDTSGEIDLQTNGTTKVHMDSSGNVGIGTSSPSNKLDIESSTQYKGLEINNGSNIIAELVGFGTGNDAGGLKLRNSGTSTVELQASGNSFINGGNVGIGTTSPSQKLDVNGTINATAFTGDGSALTGISTSDIAAASIGTSNNSNGYIRFTNNLVIQWLRKSATGTQTITYPLAMNQYYGAYVAGVSTGNGHVRVHSISTSSITVSNAEQNILGWVLVTGRKT